MLVTTFGDQQIGRFNEAAAVRPRMRRRILALDLPSVPSARFNEAAAVRPRMRVVDPVATRIGRRTRFNEAAAVRPRMPSRMRMIVFLRREASMRPRPSGRGCARICYERRQRSSADRFNEAAAVRPRMRSCFPWCRRQVPLSFNEAAAVRPRMLTARNTLQFKSLGVTTRAV